METIGERVKKIRLDKGFTQEEFAEALDIKRAIVSANEKGTRNISQRTIKAICREFAVREEWILTGEGDMYIRTSESELFELSKKYNLSKSKYKLLKLLVDLPQDEVDAIISAAKKIAKEFEELKFT